MKGKTVALIPLRKGSKRILDKNFKPLLNKPLFCWVLDEALKSKLEEIYIFTNSQKIKKYIDDNYKTEMVKVLVRSEENASDTASTESAMMEFSDLIKHDYDNLMLIQATNPFLKANTINNLIAMLSFYDSALTVAEQKKFIWHKDGYTVNYNMLNRPLSQKYEGYLVENGACYITKRSNFLNSKNRISGNIGLYKMPEYTAVEIDTLEEFAMVESVLKMQNKENKIKIDCDAFEDLFILFVDCDGVLTDGKIHYTGSINGGRTFNVLDGVGVTALKNMDIKVIILTGELKEVESIKARAKKLGIDCFFTNNKLATAKNIIEEFATNEGMDVETFGLKNVGFIGNDFNDLELLKEVGFSFCPSDAISEIKLICDYITSAKGGDGVLREVADIIFQAEEGEGNEEV